jgi:hypothetical protein
MTHCPRCIRILIAAAAALLVLAAPARATSFSNNFTDDWGVETESGWGVNVVQQYNVMYVTWFVFGTNNQPTWFSAALFWSKDYADGSIQFDGDLYTYAGPFYGGSFNPNAVTRRKVGTATFLATSVQRASLIYNNTDTGVTVSKQIVRTLLKYDNIAGAYYGGTSERTYGCSNPASNGVLFEDPGAVTITHSANNAVTIKTPSCTYSGTYGQDGSLGRVDGTYSCTGGATGPVHFYEMRVELSGIVGSYYGTVGSCNFQGAIGGFYRQ